MPYNKGDFTQQGINGDVSALVRLNDKRVVKMVLSSDDESSNVDVQGTVYDYLNGETYPLGGTTPTGTITITENGEGIDVAQYRYADVSVSGGDTGFSIAKVTLTANAGTGGVAIEGDLSGMNEGYAFVNYYDDAPGTLQTTVASLAGESHTYNALLLSGEATYFLLAGDNITVTGDCTYDPDNSTFLITGDCTITGDPVE